MPYGLSAEEIYAVRITNHILLHDKQDISQVEMKAQASLDVVVPLDVV